MLTTLLLALALVQVPHGAAEPLAADTAAAVRPGVDELVLLGRSAAHAATAPLRWTRRDLRTGAATLIALTALSAADGAGRDLMERAPPSWDGPLSQVERLGTVENFAVLGGFFVGGMVAGDARARAVAAEGLASSLVAGALVTPALQRVTGRSRPRAGRDPHTFHAFGGSISLPSGHTTQAFAVASVIATEYPHPGVQVAAYGVAAGVALARMYHGAHFLSDVTAAALIGTAVGRTVARYGQASRAGVRARPALTPGGGAGFSVSVPVR